MSFCLTSLFWAAFLWVLFFWVKSFRQSFVWVSFCWMSRRQECPHQKRRYHTWKPMEEIFKEFCRFHKIPFSTLKKIFCFHFHSGCFCQRTLCRTGNGRIGILSFFNQLLQIAVKLVNSFLVIFLCSQTSIFIYLQTYFWGWVHC